MRYPNEHKEKTRRRILDAAAVVYRRLGYHAGSVDKVMAEAGLTPGGFYAHFRSKDELFAQTLLHALGDQEAITGKRDAGLEGAERIRAIADRYLSPAHLRLLEQGCPMPALLSELSRGPAAARATFQSIVCTASGRLAPHLANAVDPTGRATALLALLVGGLAMARAVADETLAEKILADCRELVEAGLAPPQTHPETSTDPTLTSRKERA
jgi:AcrR family transcriptional regulator